MLDWVVDSCPKYIISLRKDGLTVLLPMSVDELFDAMSEAEAIRRGKMATSVSILFRDERGSDEYEMAYYERLITMDGTNWHKSYDYTKPSAYWNVDEDRVISASERGAY